MTDSFLGKLEELRVRLEASHLQQYSYMCKNSELRENCPYALKSKKLFDLLDKAEIIELIRQIEKLV